MSKNQETKEKGVDNKKMLFMVIGVIILAIVLVYVIFFIATNKQEKEQVGKENEVINVNEEQITTEEGGHEEYSLIDMNNTENAKIEDGRKENTSTELLTDKVFGGIKLSNIKLYSQNGMTFFRANAENIGDENFESKKVTLVFKDKDGNEIKKVNAYLGNIAKGESNTLSDVTNAYDFVMEF